MENEKALYTLMKAYDEQLREIVVQYRKSCAKGDELLLGMDPHFGRMQR